MSNTLEIFDYYLLIIIIISLFIYLLFVGLFVCQSFRLLVLSRL